MSKNAKNVRDRKINADIAIEQARGQSESQLSIAKLALKNKINGCGRS